MPDLSVLEVNGVPYDLRDPTKAPAGYGLGKQTEVVINSLSDLDTVYVLNGWYKFQTRNEEKIEGHSLGMLYVNSSVSSIEQIFVPYRKNYRLIRTLHAEDGWGAWEYENPPMVVGVEYRTTERWRGNVVYAMLVDCGNMPDGNTYKAVEVAINHSGIVRPISCVGQTSVYGVLPIKYVDGNEQWMSATSLAMGAIKIDIYGGVASWTATALVKYVKL